jgi:hypothetical protein
LDVDADEIVPTGGDGKVSWEIVGGKGVVISLRADVLISLGVVRSDDHFGHQYADGSVSNLLIGEDSPLVGLGQHQVEWLRGQLNGEVDVLG